MATLIKAFTKKPEEDWSGIVRSSSIPEANAASLIFKTNTELLRSLNVITTRELVSENEYYIRYNFPSVPALVEFVESYHDRPEPAQARQKIDTMMSNNKIPVYKKLIIITDDEGVEIPHETLFANTEILRKV